MMHVGLQLLSTTGIEMTLRPDAATDELKKRENNKIKPLSSIRPTSIISSTYNFGIVKLTGEDCQKRGEGVSSVIAVVGRMYGGWRQKLADSPRPMSQCFDSV